MHLFQSFQEEKAFQLFQADVFIGTSVAFFHSGEENSERSLTMKVRRCGSQPSGKGPAENFTGNVRIDLLFEAPDPARARCASVTFEPGARTAWHTHPLGQNLIVTSGCGWVQSEGAPKEEIRAGDVV